MRNLSATARAGFAALAACLAFSCVAASTAGAVSVNITVTDAGAASPDGVCVSESLSEQNGAIVRVACNTGQFVSISPVPGGRFAGTHGGAYTHYFSSSYRGLNVAGLGEYAHGAGSIAAFRVFDLIETDPVEGEGVAQARSRRLDLLVSF